MEKVYLFAVGLKAASNSPISILRLEYFTTTQESADYARENVKKAYITRYHLGDKDDQENLARLSTHEIISLPHETDCNEAYTKLQEALNSFFDLYLKTSDPLYGAMNTDFRAGRIDSAITQFRKRMAAGKGRGPKHQEER